MKKITVIKSAASVISAALLVFTMGAGAQATGDNLMDNPSFETPSITPGQNSVMENDADVPGW